MIASFMCLRSKVRKVVWWSKFTRVVLVELWNEYLDLGLKSGFFKDEVHVMADCTVNAVNSRPLFANEGVMATAI